MLETINKFQTVVSSELELNIRTWKILKNFKSQCKIKLLHKRQTSTSCFTKHCSNGIMHEYTFLLLVALSNLHNHRRVLRQLNVLNLIYNNILQKYCFDLNKLFFRNITYLLLIQKCCSLVVCLAVKAQFCNVDARYPYIQLPLLRPTCKKCRFYQFICGVHATQYASFIYLNSTCDSFFMTV